MDPTGGIRAEQTARLDAEAAIYAILVCPDGKNDSGKLTFAAPVDGRTRLMKELFLVQAETEPGRRGELAFEFTAGPYGPSSYAVQRELERLTEMGMVSQEKSGHQEAARVGLTQAGYSRGAGVWIGLPEETAQGFYSIKSRFNAAPLSALLFYVYSSYPAYTVNSKIREEVLGSPPA